jgi:hypothetical protein
MPYEFVYKQKKYTVPSFNEIPAGALRKARKGEDDMDKAFTILEETLGIKSPVLSVIDKMSVAEFGKWLEGWTEQGTVKLGESSDS